MLVSKDKTYRTVDGRPAKVYEIFPNNPEIDHQVHGAIFTDGGWCVESWSINGKYYNGGDSNYDLEEIPDYYLKAPKTIWLKFEDGGGISFGLCDTIDGVKYKKVLD
jgi:hypothetical protein